MGYQIFSGRFIIDWCLNVNLSIFSLFLLRSCLVEIFSNVEIMYMFFLDGIRFLFFLTLIGLECFYHLGNMYRCIMEWNLFVLLFNFKDKCDACFLCYLFRYPVENFGLIC